MTQDPNRFKSYRVCVNDPAHDKPISSLNPAFIINARDPAKCPVYLIDGGYNKSTPQTYTFTVTKPPPFTQFTTAQVSAGVPAGTTARTPRFNTTSDHRLQRQYGDGAFRAIEQIMVLQFDRQHGRMGLHEAGSDQRASGLVHTAVTVPALAKSTTTDKACSFGH